MWDKGDDMYEGSRSVAVADLSRPEHRHSIRSIVFMCGMLLREVIYYGIEHNRI